MWFLSRFYTADEADKMGLVNIMVPVSAENYRQLPKNKLFGSCWCTDKYTASVHAACSTGARNCQMVQADLKEQPHGHRVLKSALNAADDGHAGLQV